MPPSLLAKSSKTSNPQPPSRVGEKPDFTVNAANFPGRFDIYIIDSGFNTVAHAALKKGMPAMKQFLSDQNLYIFSPRDSQAFLKSLPDTIGLDPIITIIDRKNLKDKKKAGYGVSLHLGTITSAHEVNWLLKKLLRVLNMRVYAKNIAKTFRDETHKQGFNGAMDIIIETLEHRVEMPSGDTAFSGDI